MKNIALAGGRGTRACAISRELYSKQFLRLPGNSESLLAGVHVRRQALVDPEDVIRVTSEDLTFFVKSTVREVTGQVPLHVICEPVGHNMAPAIGLALACTKDKLHVPPDEPFLIMTSHHVWCGAALKEVPSCEFFPIQAGLMHASIGPRRAIPDE